MKHGRAYGMGTRALALLMALLMMLSTGGFALRDGTEPQPEPMAEVPADAVSEDAPAPSEDAPAPSEDIPAPSEDVPAPSEDVPAPSEDVPAPSEDVPAPSEDAPAPSEDTPAPSEDTPAPSDDTPAPSDDPANGENVPVGGVEPAPAETDPAETTPEATIEPSATPEPTADPNAGIMTVAADAPKIILSLDGPQTLPAEGNATYTLTIENQGPGALTSTEKEYSFEFLSADSSGKDYKGNSRAKVTKVEFDSTNLNCEQKDHNVSLTAKSGNVILAANAKVTITLTVPVVSTSLDSLSFGVKIKGFFGQDGQSIRYLQNGSSITATHSAGIKDEDLTNSATGSSGEPAPGPGGNGDSGDTELTGTYNVVYHLNPPTGEDKTDVKSSDVSDTFTVGNLNNDVNFDGADSEVSNYRVKDSNGQYCYFAGWDTGEVDTSSFGTTEGYDTIAYPITNIPTSNPNKGARLIQGGPTVQASTSVGAGRYKTDLYAVWAPQNHAGMIGYSMSIQNAKLGSSDLVNGVKTVGSTVSQKLGDNGLSSKGAQKYSVLDKGWGTGNSFQVTDETPTADGYVFVGWFNKKPDNNDYIVSPSAHTIRGNEENNNIYSLDALWGNLTPGNNVAVVYDGTPHSATFQGADGNPQEKPDVNLTPGTENYSDTAPKAALEEILNGKTITVNGENFGDSDTFPTETNPGVYTYTVTAKLAVSNDYYAGKSGGGTTSLDIEATTATLTIYPVLDLTVNKTVTGATGAPTEEFTFTVAPSDTDKVHFSSGSSSPLTVKANESQTTKLYFTENGEYTITVSENKGTTPGMTYAEPQTVTVTVADLQITNVTVSGGGAGTVTDGNGAASLTFTNTYGTGNLTVTKTVVDGSPADQAKDFDFTVTLSDTSVSGERGEMSFTSGTATFKLHHGQSMTANDLPVGVTYTVTEAPDDNFTTTSTGETGTITAGGAATAAFTNTRKTGSLTVKKTVAGPSGETDKAFNFTVTLSDNTVSGTYGGMTFSGGVATFALKHNESTTATKLPAGVTYTVAETDANKDGYGTTSTGASGAIPADNTAEAVFTNTRQAGALTVSKTVSGYVETDKTFTFTVELNDTTVNDTFGDFKFENGKTTLTLKAGDSKTISGLPAGVTYTVTETPDDNFTTTSTGETGTITAGGTATAAFTNARKTGDLTVSKTVVDGSIEDQNKDFSFTVTLGDTSISGTYGGMAFANGVATFKLRHGQTVTATKLPVGVTYTVTETEESGFATTSEDATGTIGANETAEAKFTNTRNVCLTYHLNVDGLDDATFVDSKPTVSGASYTYTLQELDKVFSDRPAGASGYNATAGHITVNGKTYYFAGWAKSKTANPYDGVDYPAWSPKKDSCELMGTPTLTTEKQKEDLYAIWTENPALLGYTMTIATGDFADPTQTGGKNLGDNGTTGSGAKKYVVLDDGYNYGTDKDKEITITGEVPKDGEGTFTFLTWYNKSYYKGSGDSSNPKNNGKPFTFPGGHIYFGDTNTVFSLDAVWGQVTMAGDKVAYDGNGHSVHAPDFAFQGGEGLLESDLAKYADVNYTVTAQRRGGGDEQTTESKNPISSYSDIQLPEYTEPGVYDYTLTVTYASKEDGHGGASQTLTASAELIIYPQLTLTVEKELRNGNTNVIGAYSFAVEANGAELTKSTLSVNVHDETQKQDSTTLRFPDHGTYTVTVRENRMNAAVAPGVEFAPDQTFNVVVGDNYKISSINGTPTAEEIGTAGNAAVTLTFVNTYSGGDLVVTKHIENKGASAGTQQKFHFTVNLHNPNITTKANGNGEMKFENGVAQFDLANGESIKATALPAGLEYTITEDPVTGYETTYTVNNEPTVTGTTCEGTMAAVNVNVVFTNTYTQVGRLTVTKTVTGTGAPAEDNFRFLLTLTDDGGQPLTGSYGGVSLDQDGTYGFYLKAGGKQTFAGLPTGTHYEVKETDTPVGYTASSTNASGEIGDHDAEATAAFTNAYQTGDLTITKTVIGGNIYHPFTIHVTAVALAGRTFDTNGPTGTGSVTFSNIGSATVTLQHGQSITIQGLPAGAQYTVTEPNASTQGYDVTYTGGYTGAGSGTISTGANAVTVTNTYRGGSLTVTKTVTGVNAPVGEEFTFTVTLSDKSVDGPRGAYEHKGTAATPINFTDGVAHLTLSDGESATIQGLPAGATYTVTEEDMGAKGYTTTATGSTGTIQKGGSATAAFINDYHPGSLTVTKTVTGSGYDPDTAYSFRVTLEGKPDCNHKHGDMQFTGGVATFTLKAGDSKTATDLYDNTQFTVEELDTDQNAYETTVGGTTATSYTGTITDKSNHSATVIFNNRYRTGDLTVSKTVAGDGADTTKAFRFTVQAEDKNGAPISGTYGSMEFTGGTAAFDLHSGGSLTATGLPAGTTYTVTEAEADQHGYKTTVNGEAYPGAGFTGAITDGKTDTAAFTNTYESGGLTVTKVVAGHGSQQRAFHIYVELDDETVSGQYGEMTFEKGKANFTLTGANGSNTKTAAGLPAGVGYTVTERWADDYTTTYANQTGTITKDVTAQVTVTNTYPGGDLKITKTVIGDGADLTKDFNFTVTLSDAIDGPRGAYAHNGGSELITFADGVAHLTLRGGESATIQGLRDGTTYTVTETDANQGDYETTSTGAAGTIAEGRTAEADFTNRYCPGSLTITKTVADSGDTSRQFTFTVTLSDKTFTGDRGGVTFTNGVSTALRLAHGESVTLGRLPLCDYTVTEAEADQNGYATTVAGAAGAVASGRLSAAQPHGTAAFTNRFKRGGLTVAKTVVGTAADRQKDFAFTVTLSDTAVSGAYGGMNFSGGVASFTLRHGQSVTATGLPDGIGYEVTEDTDPNFTMTATGTAGTISDGKTAEAQFTNTHKTGSLSVSKEVTLAARGDEDKAFPFTVTLSDTTVNGTFGVNGTAMTFENGVATFGLKNNESKTATGLPAGVTATVIETDADGYETTVNGSAYPATGAETTVPLGGAGAELHFVNRYTQSGNLSITKQVAGAGADPDREFSFMVQTSDWTLNGGYGGMTFTRGTAVVTLRAGQTVTATGLPAGTTYTIYEDAATGYTATVNGGAYDPMSGVTGSIPGNDTTAAVTFTNTYQTGDLTVTKTVNGNGNQYAKFHFTLTLDDDYISGAFQTADGSLTFLDGVASFDLSAGQSITIYDLPAGVGYTLEEDPVDDYVPTITVNGTAQPAGMATVYGAVAAGPNNQVDVANHYTGGNLLITKQITGIGADPDDVFDLTLRLPNHPINGPRGGVTFENGVAAFQLKGGQSVEVQGLPNGAEYVVEEDAAKAGDMGYLVSYSPNAHGYIQDNEAGQYTARVVVTNTHAPGDLVITKRVTGAGADLGREYHFTVTIQGGCDPSHDHGLTFVNGVAAFILKDGESVEIKNLLEDAALTITETEANRNGYVTTVNGTPYNGGYTVDLADIDTHAASAVFENHRANGNLTVTKAVESAPAGRRTTFDFTVTLSDPTINGTFGNGQTGMTFTNGTAAFTLADGQSRTATGLPAGVTYTVTETEAGQHGYATTVNGAAYDTAGFTGSIADGQTATAAFTNTYHGGDLTVTKTVSVQGSARHSFPVTVTLDDTTISGTYGGMRFRDGTANFTLKHGESLTATGLPVGVTYTVTEDTENQDGYTTTYNNATGTISEGAPALAEIINHYAGGGLTVSKTVTGAGADPDAEFHFTVTVYHDGSVDTAVTGPRGECSDGTPVNFSNGTASLVLKHGQSAAIRGLPAGDAYTVREREANRNGYVTTVTGGTDPAAPVVAAGTVTEDGNATAAFTNAYQPGSLTVRKTVVGTDADKQKDFTFTVTLEDKTFAGDTGGVTFTAGQAEFTLTNGQSVTFEGLPLCRYTVEEDPVAGYETTVNGRKARSISGELTTDQGRVEASFINRYIASDLTVTNTVRGEGADLTKPFTFTVTLDDNTVNRMYGGMTFTAGVATFTLKHGESLTAVGLPAGPVTVVESDRDGYTTSVTSAQQSRAAAAPEDQDTINVALAEGARTRVDFVNEIKPVSTATPTPTATATPTPTPTDTEPDESTPTPTATPTPVSATAAPTTAPNTGDEARPVLWAALLALSALGLGAVLTLTRKKRG